jgi:hypothetical protein
MENFVYTDGGRIEAGYKGFAGDCVTRSIAIITGKPYQEVYDAINELSKSKKLGSELVKTKYGNSYQKVSSARNGVPRHVYDEYLKSLGYKWIPTMKIGSGCYVHLCKEELPLGRLLVRVSHHLTAVIDGVIYDNHDCSRGGMRCVYGYYIKNV